MAQTSTKGQRQIEEALDYAASRGVIPLVAAGNQGTMGSSAITHHPWVIPVAAYDLLGRPMSQSNLGNSIGRRGLGAPGEDINSLGADGRHLTFGSTSDPADFDLLVEAIRPAPSPMDIDVVIGVRGPIPPPQLCSGLMVPIVVFNQIYSFDRETLIKSIPKPEAGYGTKK